MYIYTYVDIYIYTYVDIYIYIWLVVSTPLKNTKVSWDDYSQYMEKVFQTMKPNIYIILHILMLTTRHPLNTELNGDSPLPPSLALSLSL